MSPDDIFASQLWLWPDLAVKRDASGRVLFVNAAFLQLYGGQAQDWHGNAVGGWPAPQGPGQSYRFETRIPGQASGDGEQVYDWIEMSLQDGAALAIARNVTLFMVPPDPKPGEVVLAVEAVEAAPAAKAEIPVEVPPAQPAFEPALAQAEVPIVSDSTEPSDSLAKENVPNKEVYIPEGIADVTTEAHNTSPVQAVAETKVETDRDFERRALPIEKDSSILGNNWRDAVIAKAVGAEAHEVQLAETEESKDGTEPTLTDQSGGNAAHGISGAQAGIRILLAEDNAINALLTRTLLEADGHTVETVEDGQLAVEAMKTAAYDLIFMDMRMPNMDGLEATRKIRALSNVPSTLPIIALTANAFDDDRNACFDSGMNDFMTKPVSAEELTDMVNSWMSGEKQKIAS